MVRIRCFMRLLGSLLVSLAVSFPALAEDAEFVNRWKSTYIAANPAAAQELPASGPATRWALEPVPGGDGYVRLRSLAYGGYLNIEAGPLAVTAAEPGWWSAMWRFQDAGDGQHVRLQNRWKPSLYIHNQFGPLVAGPIEQGWWSAMWRIERSAALQPAPQVAAATGGAAPAPVPQGVGVPAQQPVTGAGTGFAATFVNGHSAELDVVWIQSDGTEKWLATLAPGASQTVQVIGGEKYAFNNFELKQWTGDPWIATSSATTVALPYSAPAGAAPRIGLADIDPQAVADEVVAAIIAEEIKQRRTPTACWRDSFGRGVGTIPECSDDQERDGLLCYDKCEDHDNAVDGVTYTNHGGVCWQQCPEGFRNDGAFCRKAEYGRGVGFGVIPFAEWDDTKAFERCEKSEWKKRNEPGNEYIKARGKDNNCEKHGLIVYPKCKPGYENVGCCICKPTERDCAAAKLGGSFLGSCAKHSFVTWPVKGGCKDKNGKPHQNSGGLCYETCDSIAQREYGVTGEGKYYGVGPVCWSSCPDSLPVNCGASCAASEGACGFQVMDQALSPVLAAGGIAITVATAGSGAGAVTAARAGIKGAQVAGKTAGKVATKAAARATMKQTLTNQVRSALRSNAGRFAKRAYDDLLLDAKIGAVLTSGIYAGTEIAGANQFREQVKTSVRAKLTQENLDEEAIDAVVELAMTGAEEQNPASDFPWESLDPTGIAEIVVAYNLPMCNSVD